MALQSSFTDPYRAWGPRLLVLFTAGILFVDGLALAYESHLRAVLQDTGTLSSTNLFAYLWGSLLVEPVMLFVVLYYVSTRIEQHPSLSRLLPGLLVAVVVGSVFGVSVGGELWRHPMYYHTLLTSTGHMFTSTHTQTLLSWQDVIIHLGRNLLTVVAALAVARVRVPGTETVTTVN